MRKFCFTLFALFQIQNSFSQLDSIYDQNVWRTFLIHLPAGYNAQNQYPLVLNLHGLNSDAAQQQIYTQFDQVADTLGMIVVYPNGISNSWAINGNSDVDFLSHLIDTIRKRHACSPCLFVMGMSDGGFMTYKFATSGIKSISAICVGSGNMAKSLQAASISSPKIPLIHFHGTSDAIVNYNGVAPFIPPVDSTIQWWVRHNGAQSSPVHDVLPNINLSDNCTVDRYIYQAGTGKEVRFYKVNNGGHTWSGAFPAAPLGNTDQDISQSNIAGAFFMQTCSSVSGIYSYETEPQVTIAPNPFNEQLILHLKVNHYYAFTLTDQWGRILRNETLSESRSFEMLDIPSGIYYYSLTSLDGNQQVGKLIKSD